MSRADDDRVIRALMKRVMELNADSPEQQCLLVEVWANARLAYKDERKCREKLQLFVAEITGLKQAEAFLGRRLDFR